MVYDAVASPPILESPTYTPNSHMRPCEWATLGLSLNCVCTEEAYHINEFIP